MTAVRSRGFSRGNGRSFVQMTASRLLGSSALIPVAGVLALMPSQAFAQDETWDGQISVDASNPANWESNVVPGAGARVFINNGTLANQPRIVVATTYSQTNVTAGTLTIAASLTSPISISNSGVVNVVSGGGVTGAINVSGGGTLELRGPLVLGAPITLGGSGAGGNGALRNVSGNNALLGAITLSADATIGNDAGILQINGATNNGGNLLTVRGAGPTVFVGAISGSGGLTVSGPGQADLNGANTYTGTTTVNAGILLLNGGAGIIDTGRVVVNGGAFGTFNDETIGSLEGSGGFVSTSAGAGTVRLTVGGNNLSTTFAGTMGDNGPASFALGKIGTGTLTLSGNSSFSGGTTISGGTIVMGSSSALGTGEIFLGGNGTKLLTQFNGTLANPVRVLAGFDGTIAASTNTTATLSGPVRGFDGSTIRFGSATDLGTLVFNPGTVLAAATTKIRIDGGTLQLGSALGALRFEALVSDSTLPVTIGALGALDINGFATTLDRIDGTGAIRNSGAATTLTLTNNAGFAGTINSGANGMTLAGSLNGVGGFTKIGTGTLNLAAGLTANTYTGTTTIGAGTVQVNANGALGTGDIVFAGGSLRAGANAVLSNNIRINADTDVTISAAADTALSFVGNFEDGARGTTRFGTATDTGVIFAAFGSSTPLGFTNVVSPAAVSIDGGTLRVGSIQTAGYLRAVGDVIGGGINVDGTLDLNSFSTTLHQLTGTGSITSGIGAATLTTRNPLADTTWGGRLTDGVGGALTLVHDGGTLTLSSGNSHSGLTTVRSGTLRVTNGSALGGLVNGTVVDAGATLEVNLGFGVPITEAITINGTGVNNAGALALTNTVGNRMQGAITLGSDSLIRSSSGRVDFFAPINGTGQTVTFNVGLNGVLALNSGMSTGSGGLIKNGLGFVALFSPTNFTGGITINEGTLFTSAEGAAINDSVLVTINNSGILQTGASERIGNITGNGLLLIGVGHTLTLGDATNQTFAGRIAANGIGATGLVKEGTGTLTLTGVSTYTGTTTIRGGTLQIGNGGTTGALGAGNIVNNASLVFNRSDNLTAANVISGSGVLTKLGGGALTLSGNNTYTGGTTLQSGTLVVGSNSALGTGGLTTQTGTTLQLGIATTPGVSAGPISFANAINLAGNTIFDLVGITAGVNSFSGSYSSTGTNATLGGVISGTGSLTIVGAGTLTLNGENTYSGPTNVLQALVEVGNARAFGTGNVTLGSTAALRNNSGASLTLANNIAVSGIAVTMGGADQLILTGNVSGSGTLNKVQSGVLSINGAVNGFGGVLNVNGGTLDVGGVLGNAAARVNVGSGGTLGGSGTIAGAVTVNSGGILAAGNSPGTMTVGALTLNAGSLTSFELSEPGVAGGANNDLIRVTGTLTLNGGNIGIVQNTGFTNGRYTLFEFGSLAGALGNLTLNPLSGGFVGTLALDGTSIILNAAPPEDLIFWNGTTTSPTGAVVGGNGVWNFTNANFTEDDGDFTGVWAGNGFNAVFSGAAGIVTIAADTTVAPSGLAFLTDGYTIAGGNAASRLLLTGPTGVDTADNVSALIAATISGPGSLTKTGAGTLTLSAVNTYTGNTTVMGGTLINSGTLASAVTNMANFSSTGTLQSTFINSAGATAQLSGDAAQINNFGTLTIAGSLTGNAGLSNGTAGTLTVTAGTVANFTGLISNNTTVADGFTINGALSTISQFANNSGAQLLIGTTGSLTATNGVDNAGTIVNNGTISSIVRNGGTLTTTGTISGELINQLGATATVSGNVAQLSNSGTLTLTGTTIGSARLDNFGSGVVTVEAGASASFAGDIFNSGTAANAFVVNGSFSSGGLFINQASANLLVGTTGTLSATNGITNAGGATFTNNGTIANIVNNFGNFTSTGTLQNGLLNGAFSATTNLSGTVLGTINNSGTINVNGGLMGEAAFVQGGFGTLNLLGFDTGFGSIAGGGTINLGLTTLNVGSNNTSTTFAGVIDGPGRLFKTGTGTLTLSGVNTYTGETRVTGGTLALASGGQMAGLVRNGATFSNAGTVLGSVINLGTMTSTGRINGGLTQFAGAQATVSGTLNGAVNTSGALIVNGNLASDGFVSNTGTGTVLVQSGARWDVAGFDNVSTNANGFVIAGTVINSGFSINRAGATLTINGGGILNSRFFTNEGGQVNNNGLVNADVTNLGNIDNNGTWNGILSHGFGTVTSNTRWNGSFGISAGGLVINNGIWANGGDISGISSGLFENFGTLSGSGVSVFGADARLANRAVGTITLASNQQLQVGGDGIISNAGVVNARARVDAGGVIQNDASGLWTGSFSILGGGSVNNAGTITGNILNRGSLSSNGVINGDLTNEEGASTSLAGALSGNVFNSGQISLTGSTFGIRTLDQTSTGAFDLSGIDTVIGALQGAGQVLLRGGNLTLNGASGTTTFLGLISGTGGLNKVGGATQILRGDQTYTGETAILGGTLTVDGGSLAGSVRNTANFILNGRVFGDLNNVGTMQIAGQVDGLTLNNGTITNTGNSIFLGRFEQSASMGTALNLAGFNTRLGSLNGSGAVNLGTGVLTVGSDNTDARFTGVIAGEGALVKIGTGAFALVGANTFTGPTFINGGSIDLATDGVLAGAVENNATFVVRGRVNGLVVNSGSLTSTGRLNGGLFNASGATANVSGQINGAVDNLGLITLTGTTTGIGTFAQGASGVFNLAGFDTTIGALSGAGSVQLGSAFLTIDPGNTGIAFTGVISGSGGIIKNGAGTLRLDGVNTYTGLTTVNGGTLLINNGAVLAGSLVNNAATLNGGTINGDVTNNSNYTNFGRIIGSLTNNGAAGLFNRIDGAIFNNGTISASGGTYFGRFTQAAGASADFSGFPALLGSLAGEGTIQLLTTLEVGSDNTSSTFAGVISGTGALVKTGTRTFTLDGVNTYTGTTFVNAGTLVVGESGMAVPPPPPSAPGIAAVTAPATAPNASRTLLVRGEGGLSNGRATVSMMPEAEAVMALATAPEEAPFSAMSTMLSNAVIAGNVVNSATLINNGTILGQVLNNAGASATNHGVIGGAVFNNGTLVSTGTLGGGLDNSGTAQLAGVVDGTVINRGSIVLTGTTTGIDIFEQTAAGTLDLAGFNTTIGAISGAGSITLGSATLTTGTDGLASLFSGVISGTGALVKTGTGRLVLTGTNTYSGGTTISGGVLQLGDGGTSGSIIGPVVNNGALVINRSDAYTFAGVISGTGMFVQDGTGTTTLTAANTYSGGTLISRGRLVGNTTSLQGVIQNDAALEFAQATAGTFAGQLLGTGLFDKTGAGMLTLTGNSNGLTGGTFVRAGELRVLGQLANSRVTVLSGATLSGTGVIGGLTANSGAVIAPGAGGAGTLGVNGTVSLAAGSTVQFDVRATGASDLIVSTGAATLGGTAAFNNLGGVYAFNSEYVLIQADGGRSGTFAANTGFGGFGILYRPELVYSANQVRLRMAPNLLANIVGNAALTPNQRSVVNRIDGAVTAGYNPQPLFNIYALPTAQLVAAFDQLSGEGYATSAGVGIEQERLLREAVLVRTGAAARAARANPEAAKGVGAWGQVFGGWGDGEGDGNAAAFDADRMGFVTGLDYGNASENGSWRAGLFGMRVQSDVTIDARVSAVEVRQAGGGAYASLDIGGFGVTLGGYLAEVDLRAFRNISLPGFAETNVGTTEGTARQAFAELSYTIAAGDAEIRPFVSGSMGSFKLDGLTEQGGAAALVVRSQSYDTGSVTGGIDAAVPVGKKLRFDGTLAARAQLGDRNPQALIALAASPQQAFAVSGVQLDKTAIAARFEAILELEDNLSMSVGYTGLIGETVTDHGARATIQVRF